MRSLCFLVLFQKFGLPFAEEKLRVRVQLEALRLASWRIIPALRRKLTGRANLPLKCCNILVSCRDSRNPVVPVGLEFFERRHLLALFVQLLDGRGPRIAREEASVIGLDRVPLGLEFQ